MIAKRTPGPWHVAGDGDTRWLLPIFITPEATHNTRETIATVHMANYHPGGLEAAKTEARENAAFIILACNAHDRLTAENARLRACVEGLLAAIGACVEDGTLPKDAVDTNEDVIKARLALAGKGE